MTTDDPRPDPIADARAEIDSSRVEPAPSSGPQESAGEMIGRYKLLEPIGEGGMGTVWMAQQREPITRRVALKIIKLGMDTKQVIARFEAERQALALMSHDHIAKVLDAGTTELGRPYFVMELVRGVPISEYCDAERLDTRKRLELFGKVCAAVQHAHQKGVIHRDIKPGNVLVTLHDGVPVPKVIDFGIAKATNQELTEKTLFTEYRQIIGTPAYMAPEQAEMSGFDIDTRADIYSLGVLLYELLTGTTPFDMRSLMKAGYDEMLRAIREDEPHKPSTRISTLGDTATSIAGSRHTDPGRLGGQLQGDLDWIVMKCLEKDRARRYASAESLAEDLRRHLEDEPVEAGPPNPSYLLRKFVRRHRVGVIACSTVAAAVLLGLTATIWTALWALDERDRADEAAQASREFAQSEAEARRQAEVSEQLAVEESQRAQEAREEADASRDAALEAEAEARSARDDAVAAEADARLARDAALEAEGESRARAEELAEVVDFQDALLENLDLDAMGRALRAALLAAAPDADRAELAERLTSVNTVDVARVTLRDSLIAETIAAIDEQFAERPLLQSRLFLTLSIAVRGLNITDVAVTLAERSVGLQREHAPDDAHGLCRALNGLGVALRSVYDTEGAWRVMEESVGLARLRLDEEDVEAASAFTNMALLLCDAERVEEALPLLDEALLILETAGTPGSLDTHTMVMGIQAQAFSMLGDRAASIDAHARAVTLSRERFGDQHPRTILATVNWSAQLLEVGRLEEAADHLQELLDVCLSVHGEEHRVTLNVMLRLAESWRGLGLSEAAWLLLERGIEVAQRVLPDDDAIKLGLVTARVRWLLGDRRMLEVAPFAREALELCLRTVGEVDRVTVDMRSALGNGLLAQGAAQEAASQFEAAIAARRELATDPDWLLPILERNLAMTKAIPEPMQNARRVGFEARQRLPELLDALATAEQAGESETWDQAWRLIDVAGIHTLYPHPEFAAEGLAFARRAIALAERLDADSATPDLRLLVMRTRLANTLWRHAFFAPGGSSAHPSWSESEDVLLGVVEALVARDDREDPDVADLLGTALGTFDDLYNNAASILPGGGFAERREAMEQRLVELVSS